MRRKSRVLRERVEKATVQTSVPKRQVGMAEHKRRWGIQDDGVDDVHDGQDGSIVKVRLIPMILDLEKSYHDNNFIMIGNIANEWLFNQPESRVPGVPEALKVALTRKRTGIVGGIGSPEHANATNAMTRFRENSTKGERIKATKAAYDLLVRLRDWCGNDLIDVKPDQASTTEKIIGFYAEHGGNTSTMVQ
jgi:hypothetical protein